MLAAPVLVHADGELTEELVGMRAGPFVETARDP